ncbi:MAG: tRNA (adenosine(37)-N6)-threonylcarbamoyltransferase complex transferase subunit TsaD [Defluviitaleaceae bacterium]|nr:tRNA (adenosine(37)-N6)-threonylcarbamoyltransferase complex transferase subunit TsaD [Defluviitaleaceae bacterium]
MIDDVIILGIETSCDETAAAVVVNGCKVLSNVIASQIDIHREYGGVVPEIAARKHVESVSYIVKEALRQANILLADVNGIAVSNGPGLVGALLVGLSYAKALAFTRRIPLIGVHHIYSHICANYLDEAANWEPPFMCLVVSGGHTHLIEVMDYHNCRVLGRTRDDAAGEAFDKVGRVLGLPYPGGPEIDRLAKHGDAKAIVFPKTTFEDSLDFSFSGLKSAVLQYLQKNKKDDGFDINVADVAASFQQTAIDVLVSRTLDACEQSRLTKVALAGGVAANGRLREAMAAACAERGLTLNLPPGVYCTDNAAMVASGGYYRYIKGVSDSYDLNAYPNMDIVGM